jgi:hypothetical protein
MTGTVTAFVQHLRSHPLSQISPSLARMANLTNDPRFTVPAVALSALASDADGTVSKVELFDGDVLIGTATATCDVTWKDVPLGLHEIVAVATDDAGSATISTPVQITVTPDGAQTGFITGTTLGTFRKSLSGWLGMRISVGPDPITITDLGRFCLSGNQGKHMLKLVRAMDERPCRAQLRFHVWGRIGEFASCVLIRDSPTNTSYYLVSRAMGAISALRMGESRAWPTAMVRSNQFLTTRSVVGFTPQIDTLSGSTPAPHGRFSIEDCEPTQPSGSGFKRTREYLSEATPVQRCCRGSNSSEGGNLPPDRQHRIVCPEQMAGGTTL